MTSPAVSRLEHYQKGLRKWFKVETCSSVEDMANKPYGNNLLSNYPNNMHYALYERAVGARRKRYSNHIR